MHHRSRCIDFSLRMGSSHLFPQQGTTAPLDHIEVRVHLINAISGHLTLSVHDAHAKMEREALTFSLNSAPPRPLTTLRSGSTSSAPSIARSSSCTSSRVASGMPRPAKQLQLFSSWDVS